MKLFFVVMLSLISQTGFACSCNNQSIGAQVNNSDFIYIGLVTNTKQISNESQSTLDITEVLKGVPDSNKLLHGAFIPICSREAKINHEYLVFGNYENIPYLTVCTPTQPTRNITKERMSFIRSTTNKQRNEMDGSDEPPIR